MSELAQIIVATLGTVATVGGGGVAAFFQMRKSRRMGVRDEDIQAQETSPVDDYRALVEDLAREVSRLREDQAEDRDQIRQIRAEIAAERNAKWAAIQYIRILHAWIAHHVPGLEPPPVPDDLAPHVVVPRKE